MAVHDYSDLLQHFGHVIGCVVYGDESDPHNVALECETCGVVLMDFDNDEAIEPVKWKVTRHVKESVVVMAINDEEALDKVEQMDDFDWVVESCDHEVDCTNLPLTKDDSDGTM